MEPNELAQELTQRIETATEAEVRAFIIEHFEEFPEEVRSSLARDLLVEALESEVSAMKEISDVKEKAATLIDFANGETATL